jgi:hypothetical protein
MKTNYAPILENILKEFFVDTDTAIIMLINQLNERGHTLPFSNPQEYREYEVKVSAENSAELAAIQEESKFIKSLRYLPHTIQHKKEIFRMNMDSLIREYNHTEEQAFERVNRLTPGIFDTIAAFQNYRASLKHYIPEMISKGARRF